MNKFYCLLFSLVLALSNVACASGFFGAAVGGSPFTPGTISSPTTGVTVSGGSNAVNGAGVTISLATAGPATPGLMGIGAQTFAGAKTFSTGPDFTTGNVTKGGQSFIRSVGTNNFAAGQGAGQVDAGFDNTMLGANAGTVNSTGTTNSFGGVNSGFSNTTGTGNSCFGANTCRANVSGFFTVALGVNAGFANLASDNTFGGASAGFSNTSGTPNAYYGRNSGRLNSTGSNNSCYGPSSCFNANASNITAMGANAGVLTTANNGTFIGTNAGSTATTGANLIMIGNNVQPTTATTSDETRVGSALFADATSTSLRAGGATGITVSNSGTVVSTPSSTFQITSGNITKINNVATSWPASQGGVGTFLKNNGSGVFSWANSLASLGIGSADFTPNFEVQIKGGAGNSTIQLTNNTSGSTATDGMLMDFDGTNMTFNNQEGQTFNTASSFSFTGGEINLIDGNFLVSPSTDIDAGYTFNNASIGVSSSVLQRATTGALEIQNNGGAGINLISPGLRINGSSTEAHFQRSCTISSASSATPTVCLDTLDIGTGQVAHISGFRAKVNGGTAWTGVVTCSIKDAAAVSYVDIPVANLTGNAYINDSTAGVALNNPFSLGTGGTADNGINIVCNSNGITGSDLVVTMYGVIK